VAALVFVCGILLVGAIEGSAVGLAQWLALRDVLPGIARREWLAATVAGAICAWAAGMLIGTQLGHDVDIPQTPLALLAVALTIGAIAGALLSGFQWLVLRQAVVNAGWWVPSHAGAWAFGMLVAFAGTNVIDDNTPVPVVALVGAATGLVMGALVAAVTGLVLVRVLRQRPASISDKVAYPRQH
jgi:hypothetical protein